VKICVDFAGKMSNLCHFQQLVQKDYCCSVAHKLCKKYFISWGTLKKKKPNLYI